MHDHIAQCALEGIWFKLSCITHVALINSLLYNASLDQRIQYISHTLILYFSLPLSMSLGKHLIVKYTSKLHAFLRLLQIKMNYCFEYKHPLASYLTNLDKGSRKCSF